MLRSPLTGEAQEKPRRFRLFLLNLHTGLPGTAEWADGRGFPKEKPLQRGPGDERKLHMRRLGGRGGGVAGSQAEEKANTMIKREKKYRQATCRWTEARTELL